MPPVEVRLLLDPDVVDSYLAERGLLMGSTRLDAVCLQLNATQEGRPAAIFVAEVDGKPVAFKTTLRILEAAVAGMRAVEAVYSAGGGRA